jgi:hypothetical protein
VLDPLHYLVTLGRKPAALDHANVYRDWQLPPAFGELRRALEHQHGPRAGARHYICVLQLLAEHPVERVHEAIVRSRQGDRYDAAAILRRTQHLGAQSDLPNQPGSDSSFKRCAPRAALWERSGPAPWRTELAPWRKSKLVYTCTPCIASAPAAVMLRTSAPVKVVSVEVFPCSFGHRGNRGLGIA